MAFKEYKDYSKEFNDVGKEYKQIDVVESISPQEMATPPDENYDVPEESDQVNDSARIERDTNQRNNDNQRGQRNNNDSNDGSNAASSAVVASTATLAGGVTILSAVAIVAATVGSSIMNKSPKVLSQNIEAGADYLLYEIDVRELTEGTKYKIKVHNSTFEMEYPIETEGVQRQLVTGLTPFRKYNVSIVAEAEEFGDIEYYSYECYTSKFKKPRAIIEFVPRINYEASKFDLLYEAYVSDFYKTGSNTYLEIYAGAGEDRRKVIDDHDLPENNFFKGVLENVADGTKFSAEVWTTYYGDNTLIGSVNDYMTKYPEDFADDNFVSEFIFDFDAFSSSYSEEGYTLFINTDFDNSNNTSEAYKIDLFYNGEQLTNSSSTTEKELEFKLPKYVSYVDAVFTPIKRFDTGEKELTEKKFKYVLEPRLFDVEYRFFEESYYLRIQASEEYFDTDSTFKSEFKYHMLNGDIINNDNMEFEYGYFEDEVGQVPDGYELSDLDYIEINIDSSTGEALARYKLKYNVAKVQINGFEITDDGNVKLPYNIILDDATFLSANGELDGAGYVEFENAEGVLDVTTLKDNYISGGIYVNYIDSNGIETEAYVPIEYTDNNGAVVDRLDLNAQITATAYVTYQSSNLVGHVKLEAIADGKLLNMDFGLQGYEYDEFSDSYYYVDVEESGKADGKYYEIEGIQLSDPATYEDTEKYFTYKVTAKGFEGITDVENRHDIDIATTKKYASSEDIYEYNVTTNQVGNNYYVYYIKTSNADGTVNYYFNPEFATDDPVISGRLKYSYVDSNGVTRYFMTDYSQSKYVALENVSDEDYKFTFATYYYAADAITGNEEYYEVKEYECHLLDNALIANVNNADIQVREGESVSLSLSFDNNSFNKDENIIINFDKKDYSIDPTVPSFENADYSYRCMDTDGKFRIELIIKYNEISNDYINQSIKENMPTVTFDSLPSVVSQIGLDKIKNYEAVTGPCTVPLFEYTGKYDIDDLNYSIETGTWAGLNMVISFGDFNDQFSNDDLRDSIKVYILVDGKVVREGEYDPYDTHSTYRITALSPIYSKFTVKVVEIKKTTSFIEYNTIAEKEFDYSSELLETTDVIDNVMIQAQDNTYSIDLRINDNSSYYESEYYSYKLNVYELVDGEYVLVGDGIPARDETLSYSKEGIPSAVRFDICRSSGYGTDVIIKRIDYSFDVGSSSGYTIEDDLTTINIPFEINIPEGLTLDYAHSMVGVNGMMRELTDGETSGTIQIDELSSSTAVVTFQLAFTDAQGRYYGYIQNVDNKLQAELNVNYVVLNAAKQGSSFAYAKIYKSKADGTEYWNWGNSVPSDDPRSWAICDAEGNPVGATETDIINHGVAYYLEGTVYGKIGNHIVDYGDEFSVDVITAGKDISESLYNNPSLQLDPYTIDGDARISDKFYVTFLMSETGETYINTDNYDFEYNYVKGEISFVVLGANGEEIPVSLTVNEPEYKAISTVNLANFLPGICEYNGSTFTYNDSDVAFVIDRDATYNESNNTVNISYNTEFDSTLYPNYAYVVRLYDQFSKEVVYTSDYLTTDTFNLDIPNKPGYLEFTIYEYVDGIGYVETNYYRQFNSAAINSAVSSSAINNYDDYVETIFYLKSYDFDGVDTNYYNEDSDIYVIIDGNEQIVGPISALRGTGDITAGDGVVLNISGSTVTVTSQNINVGSIGIRVKTGTEGNYRDSRYVITR